MNKSLVLFLKGFAMGIADIIPGVSGGTIAFITGIYQRLINAITMVDKEFFVLIFKVKLKEAFSHIDAQFLIPLLLGIMTAIFSLSRLIHYLLDFYPVETWAVFFGLILSSTHLLYHNNKKFFALKNIVIMLLGIIGAYFFVSLIPIETSQNHFVTFGSGMVAICAMILPGISGSFLLLILGQYFFITGAIKQFYHFDNFITLIIFASGCALGLGIFARFLKWVLKNYYELTLSFLTGVMLGALKKVWPWQEALQTVWDPRKNKEIVLTTQTYWPDMNLHFALVLGLMTVGVMVVFFLEKIANSQD